MSEQLNTANNIVFIVFDTARAKTLLPGLEAGLMPSVAGLAEDGTMFTKAMTTAPWTLPSHASLFTGQYPSEHQAHAGSKEFDPEAATMAEQLRSAGYDTGAVSGNVWISPEFGFDRGFEQFSMKYDYTWGGADLSQLTQQQTFKSRSLKFLELLVGPESASKTLINGLWGRFFANSDDDGANHSTSLAIDWIDRRKDSESPFFFFMNYLEPHLEYDPPLKYASAFLPDDADPDQVESINQDPWEYIAGNVDMDEEAFEILQSLYKAEFSYLDTQVGRLIRFLENVGLYDETAIIIVGDHGENIGDHGLMDHQYCLYDTLTHVPLIIKWPGNIASDTSHDGLVETRDLYPTILDIAGLTTKTPKSCSKNSINPRDLTASSREYIISEYLVPQPSMDSLREQVSEFDPTVERYDRALRSIRTEDWKFIEASDDHKELYRIKTSANENKDIVDSKPEVASRLQSILLEDRGQLERGDLDTASMTDQSRERLENLGYIQ